MVPFGAIKPMGASMPFFEESVLQLHPARVPRHQRHPRRWDDDSGEEGGDHLGFSGRKHFERR